MVQTLRSCETVPWVGETCDCNAVKAALAQLLQEGAMYV